MTMAENATISAHVQFGVSGCGLESHALPQIGLLHAVRWLGGMRLYSQARGPKRTSACCMHAQITDLTDLRACPLQPARCHVVGCRG